MTGAGVDSASCICHLDTVVYNIFYTLPTVSRTFSRVASMSLKQTGETAGIRHMVL